MPRALARLLPVLPATLLTLAAADASAVSATSNIPVSGSFSSTIGVTGNAQLTSASGNFKQWLAFFHANIGVSASAQTVGVTMTSSPNVNVNGSGTANLTYDPLTPGTPQALTQALPTRALDIDINGAGGLNTPINFDLAVGNLNINTSLGTFQLQLTIDAEITDLTFKSTAGSAANPGYLTPGDLTATLNGAVTGKLVNVPILGTLNLGTLYTLTNAPLSFNVPLPGSVSTSDVQGGAPPYPNDMQATFALSVMGLSIPFPFTQPLNVATSQSVPNGQSGFSSLNVNANLNATITLENPTYSYTGVAPNALVPEPATALLFGLGIGGLVFAGRRRG